ncbi:hypothetical protein LPJ53_002216 [Coemansia erecta]|uniref:Tropomyosin n=1 Tax=Coemansia erecta TaxID=147472 RepID=A0A9W8CRE2_9FUNG|nr:hypothetical protein LPJ53_002216 [Coemansia erecta]
MAEARAAGIEQKLTAANEKIGVFEQDLETAKKDATEASQRAEEFGGNLRDLEQRFNEIASRNLSCIDENKDLKKKLHDAEHALAVAEERTASLNTLFQEIGHDVLAVSKKIMTVTSDNDA